MQVFFQVEHQNDDYKRRTSQLKGNYTDHCMQLIARWFPDSQIQASSAWSSTIQDPGSWEGFRGQTESEIYWGCGWEGEEKEEEDRKVQDASEKGCELDDGEIIISRRH